MTCRPIIVCFLLAFANLTCSKDDNTLDITFGKTYLKRDIQPIGKIRVYDKNGEIKDPDVSDQIAADIDYYTNYLQGIVLTDQLLDSLRFSSASEASLSNYGTQHSYLVNQDKSFRILTGKEITDNFSINQLCSENFDYRISKYQNEILNNELTSSVGGVYRFQCKVHQRFVFNTANNELTFSIYVYVIRDRITNSNTPGKLYNELKNDFYKELDADSEFAFQQLIVSYQ